mgnify:CR=1 FL=1
MIRCTVMMWCLLAPILAQDTIRIGAKNFTESAVLAELMAQTIEAHTDRKVELRTGLGGTMICWAALKAGEIDIYAEYTGTGWMTILGQTSKVTDPLRAFFEVRKRCREEHDVHWLEPFGLNNTYALAMREATADELEVKATLPLAADASATAEAMAEAIKTIAIAKPCLWRWRRDAC